MALQHPSIVTEFKTKTEEGFTISNPIGTDIKFILNGRNPSNNNLEEDLILGTNKITKIQDDFEEEAVRKTIEYRTTNKTSDYYILEVFLYGVNSNTSSIDISDNQDILEFTILGNEGYTFPPKTDIFVSGTGLYLRNNNYYFSDNGLHQREYDINISYKDPDGINISPTFITEKDELQYQGENEKILVATKEKTEYFDGDNKHYINEVINHRIN